MAAILILRNVTKRYSADAVGVDKITLSFEGGEFTALAGPSGSGKTTLLNLSAGLDKPGSGEVHLLRKNLKKLSLNELAQLRRRAVGFIFQSYNLFPVLTIRENIEYPLALCGISAPQRKESALQALDTVGLRQLGNRFPSQLSGGQQQRVAIARAIVNRPKIIFADEPTANLDSKTASHLLALFESLNKERNITFVFSSHDPLVLTRAKRVITLEDGRLKKDSGIPPPEPKILEGVKHVHMEPLHCSTGVRPGSSEF